jgi:hypothetical protein
MRDPATGRAISLRRTPCAMLVPGGLNFEPALIGNSKRPRSASSVCAAIFGIKRMNRAAVSATSHEVAAAVGADVAPRHRGEGLLLSFDDHDRPHSSSASRVTAGA